MRRTTTILALVLFSKRPIRGHCQLLAFTTLLLAFPWALPLFVSADEKALARPPALLSALRGGRVTGRMLCQVVGNPAGMRRFPSNSPRSVGQIQSPIGYECR